jgi:hypothetical protein
MFSVFYKKLPESSRPPVSDMQLHREAIEPTGHRRRRGGFAAVDSRAGYAPHLPETKPIPIDEETNVEVKDGNSDQPPKLDSPVKIVKNEEPFAHTV